MRSFQQSGALVNLRAHIGHCRADANRYTSLHRFSLE